jgi:hypothetical protein
MGFSGIVCRKSDLNPILHLRKVNRKIEKPIVPNIVEAD